MNTPNKPPKTAPEIRQTYEGASQEVKDLAYGLSLPEKPISEGGIAFLKRSGRNRKHYSMPAGFGAILGLESDQIQADPADTTREKASVHDTLTALTDYMGSIAFESEAASASGPGQASARASEAESMLRAAYQERVQANARQVGEMALAGSV